MKKKISHFAASFLGLSEDNTFREEDELDLEGCSFTCTKGVSYIVSPDLDKLKTVCTIAKLCGVSFVRGWDYSQVSGMFRRRVKLDVPNNESFEKRFRKNWIPLFSLSDISRLENSFPGATNTSFFFLMAMFSGAVISVRKDWKVVCYGGKMYSLESVVKQSDYEAVLEYKKKGETLFLFVDRLRRVVIPSKKEEKPGLVPLLTPRLTFTFSDESVRGLLTYDS